MRDPVSRGIRHLAKNPPRATPKTLGRGAIDDTLSPRPRALSGEIATQRLYNIARSALRRVLRREPAEFEDLLQSVLERVLRSLRDHTFSHQCSVSTWVSVIAANVAIDWVRSRSRFREQLELVGDLEFVDSFPATGRAPLEELLEARSALRHVENLIRAMTPGHGDPFVLYDVYGLDLGEVAEILKISVPAAQSRVVRARHELRRRLEALDEESPALQSAVPPCPESE